jgi:hypothetical protein
MTYQLIPAERVLSFADCSGGPHACWPWLGGIVKLRGGYGVKLTVGQSWHLEETWTDPHPMKESA